MQRRGRETCPEYGFALHLGRPTPPPSGTDSQTENHMSSRKAFALRIDEKTMKAMHRWAEDDLRSLNAQIEFVLREALRKAGRLKEGDRSRK